MLRGPLSGRKRMTWSPTVPLEQVERAGRAHDATVNDIALAAVAGALRRHLPAGDVLAGYPERLEDPALGQGLRGFLTGTIDLVVRLPGAVPRFVVLDHKTNRLAAPGEEPQARHFRPSALAVEMQRSHYVLQGLLYAVALHRYLRWRLAGYRPEVHLAGIVYLFLRGMTGPGTPEVDGGRCGVFAWRPPGGLVEELSDVLDRGEGGA